MYRRNSRDPNAAQHIIYFGKTKALQIPMTVPETIDPDHHQATVSVPNTVVDLGPLTSLAVAGLYNEPISGGCDTFAKRASDMVQSDKSGDE